MVMDWPPPVLSRDYGALWGFVVTLWSPDAALPSVQRTEFVGLSCLWQAAVWGPGVVACVRPHRSIFHRDVYTSKITYRWGVSFARSFSFGWLPMIRSTACPSLNKISVGMLITPN